MKDYTKYWNALTFASMGHGEQKRKVSNIPYIIHPVRITSILRSAGFSEHENEDLMIAALFHDLIEDTETKFDEIKDQFGEKIAMIVNELTKPENGDKEHWLKSFDSKSNEAKIIKMADRIDNLKDISQINWSEEKKRFYIEHGRIIVDKCGNAHSDLACKLEQLIEKLSNQF